MTSLVESAIDGGAHHDFVNNYGKTPLEWTWLKLMKLA